MSMPVMQQIPLMPVPPLQVASMPLNLANTPPPLASLGGIVPVTYMRPSTPQVSSTTPRDRAMTLLPQQPEPQEMQAVQEHLLQRPLNEHDQQHANEFMDSLNVTFGDYAPGGENMPGDDAGRIALR